MRSPHELGNVDRTVGEHGAPGAAQVIVGVHHTTGGVQGVAHRDLSTTQVAA